MQAIIISLLECHFDNWLTTVDIVAKQKKNAMLNAPKVDAVVDHVSAKPPTRIQPLGV